MTGEWVQVSTLTITLTKTYNWLKFMPGRRRNQQVMNPGRFQVQGDRLEKSTSWAQEDIPTKQMIEGIYAEQERMDGE